MLMYIEIALCLALIYALGALACSVIHEAVAQTLALRWKSLNKTLNDMLDPADYARFMAHPLIRKLWDGSRKPTLIPDLIAARAIVHAFEPADATPITDAQALLQTLPAALQRKIVPFLDQQLSDVQQLYHAAQTWFTTAMTAASDWYGRQAHWISILVAIGFAVALNVNTITIASVLAQEPAQRVALVELAQATLKQYQSDPNSICPELAGSSSDPQARLSSCIALLGSAGGSLIGWSAAARAQLSVSGWLGAALGWLASGLAMSLGARFWFDMLSRLISVRAGLAPAEAAAAGKKTA